jgi:hypothetical protein
MSGVRWARVARAFRRVALPLASYYAVTLAVPLANGATPSGTFMEHALVVLVVPPIAIILGCAVHTIAHALVRLWTRRADTAASMALDARSFPVVREGTCLRLLETAVGMCDTAALPTPSSKWKSGESNLNMEKYRRRQRPARRSSNPRTG